MNKRKKLPKAVLLTADDLRDSVPQGNQRSDPPPWSGSRSAPRGRAELQTAGPLSNVIEMAPKPDGSTGPAPSAAPAPMLDDVEAWRRRRRAQTIVERHANLSAIGGVVPLPVVNVAAVTAIIVRMVKSLSVLYGVPFERNRARALAVGLMGGVMPTGLGTVAASTLIYVVPGYNLLGLAISSVTASASARSIGRMLIEYFETGSAIVDAAASGPR